MNLPQAYEAIRKINKPDRDFIEEIVRIAISDEFKMNKSQTRMVFDMAWPARKKSLEFFFVECSRMAGFAADIIDFNY